MSAKDILTEASVRLDLLYQFIDRNRSNLESSTSSIIEAMNAVWDAQSAVEKLVGDLSE